MKKVDEEFQTIKVTQTATTGKSTASTRTFSQAEEKEIAKIAQLAQAESQHFSVSEVAAIEKQQPVSVLREEFCEHADSLVVYESEGTIFVFAFRSAVANDEDVTFLGKFSFSRDALTDKQVLEKATAVRSAYKEESALSAIVEKHSSYAGLAPEQTEVKQLGDYTRAAFVFTVDGFRNRFLVDGSPAGAYEIIEECRLEKTKDVYTETKVSVTGETSVATNDVVRVVKEDQTAKEVVENIKREVPQVQQQEPVAIKITDYEKKTEYVVNFEQASEEETLTKQEVLVVHDKVSHNN